MAMVCAICSHPKRDEIEQAMLRSQAVRAVARQFPGISKDQVGRHRRHIAQALVKDSEAKRANGLAQEVRGLIEEAHRLRGAAECKQDIRAALKGLDVALRALELYGKATGELNDKRGPSVTVNLNMTPAEGISEALELLLLLAGRSELARIIAQLQDRVAELEQASACAASVQHAPETLDSVE